jgi:hypothetical protein
MGHKQRLRAGRQQALSMDDDEIQDDLPGGSAVEIETQDPPATAQETVSSPAAAQEDRDDPLEALKRQFADLEAERNTERKRREDAEARAREHETQLGRYEADQFSHKKTVLEQAYAGEELKLADAKRKYAAAIRDQDFDAAADAQSEMVRADGTMRHYAFTYQDLENQEKQPKRTAQPAPQEDQFEVALKTMHPKVAEWARTHKDDVTKPERQRLAFAADQMAIAKGYNPGSDEYLDYMDESMGYIDQDDAATRPAPPQVQRVNGRRAPAAPPSRSASSTKGRVTTHLTADDHRQLESINALMPEKQRVTVEQYAKNKYEAQKRGELNGGYRDRLSYRSE